MGCLNEEVAFCRYTVYTFFLHIALNITFYNCFSHAPRRPKLQVNFGIIRGVEFEKLDNEMITAQME